MLTATSVIGPTAQHNARHFNALAEAIRSNTAYGNIHTTSFPAGEIRGEIRRNDTSQTKTSKSANSPAAFAGSATLPAFSRCWVVHPLVVQFGGKRAIEMYCEMSAYDPKRLLLLVAGSPIKKLQLLSRNGEQQFRATCRFRGNSHVDDKKKVYQRRPISERRFGVVVRTYFPALADCPASPQMFRLTPVSVK